MKTSRKSYRVQVLFMLASNRVSHLSFRHFPSLSLNEKLKARIERLMNGSPSTGLD